jgi:hypothetical protein
MPYDDPEPDDPSMLVGVALPGDVECAREMAATFADEFAALGFNEARLLALFHQPFYVGAHQALQILGEAIVRDLVRESVGFWGRCRVVVHDAGGHPHASADRIDVPLISLCRPEADRSEGEE